MSVQHERITWAIHRDDFPLCEETWAVRGFVTDDLSRVTCLDCLRLMVVDLRDKLDDLDTRPRYTVRRPDPFA